MTSLAEYLKRLREVRDVSQTQVSDKAELSETYYGKIELGQRRPSAAVLGRICAALACTKEETRQAMTILAESMLSPELLELVMMTKPPTRAGGSAAASVPLVPASPAPPSVEPERGKRPTADNWRRRQAGKHPRNYAERLRLLSRWLLIDPDPWSRAA